MLKLKLNTLATWCEELTHWKRPCCWERLKAGGEGNDRGPDGWMASPTWWTWIWASSGSWWWTGKPGMLQSMGWQSWTRLSSWTELIYCEIITVIKVVNISITSNSYHFNKKNNIWLCHTACRILVPWSGMEPSPLQWKLRVLTTEPSGNTQLPLFNFSYGCSSILGIPDQG